MLKVYNLRLFFKYLLEIRIVRVRIVFNVTGLFVAESVTSKQFLTFCLHQHQQLIYKF